MSQTRTDQPQSQVARSRPNGFVAVAVEDEHKLLPPSLVWVYLAGGPVAAFLFDPHPWNTWQTGVLSILKAYVPFIVIPVLLHSLYHWIMPPVLARYPGRVRHIVMHVFAALAMGTVGAVVSSSIYATVLYRPVSFGRYWVVCLMFSLAITLPALAIQRLRLRVRDHERKLQQEKRVSVEAQLAALQARTNPHFLFNSINTVASLIPENPALAEETLERLADLFRYALESGRTRVVPLKKELEIVEDYLHVQATRFGGRLRWSITVDPHLSDLGVAVPPLILQPLVENAVVHGIDPSPDGGTIAVEAWLETSDPPVVVCTVNDDGPGTGGKAPSNGIAIREARARLKLIHGDRAQLVASPRPDRGFQARIALPVEGVA